MSIVRQVDSDYNDDFVAFVDSAPIYRKVNAFEDRVSGETYRVELHRKPLNGLAFKYCRHEHRSIDAAIRCARKLLKLERRG